MVTGICRVLSHEGLRVAPFKAQNLSLNACAVPGGGEIGYAQALQARAAGIAPTVDMNPILVKPQANQSSQWIVQGRPKNPPSHPEANGDRSELFAYARDSFDRLAAQYDVIILEGAGSPVELNLMASDLANFKMAGYAGANVILVGDIDRGGIFAAMYGTLELLSEADRNLVVGLVVNKFRGDPQRFVQGRQILEQVTGKPVLGVVPFHAFGLPEEDGSALDGKPTTWRAARVRIAVVKLPHISNFTDLTALEAETEVSLAWLLSPGDERPDVVVIPGSKATISDLRWLHERGWERTLKQWRAEGTIIFGICGGYQMLGLRVLDPLQLEGPVTEAWGLGLIPATTSLQPEKRAIPVQGLVQNSTWPRVSLCGYEIHLGHTVLAPGAESFLTLSHGPDGYVDPSGRVVGTYVHGIFDGLEFRQAFLAQCGASARGQADPIEAGLDQLETVIRQSISIATLRQLVET